LKSRFEVRFDVPLLEGQGKRGETGETDETGERGVVEKQKQKK
jgi:hypothetical protein